MNNLVSQFLKISGESAESNTLLRFSLERDSWICLGVEAQMRGEDRILFRLGSSSRQDVPTPVASRARPSFTQMWFAKAGENEIELLLWGKPYLKRLYLNRIPELIFNKFGAQPKVSSYGDYNGAFFRENVFPYITTIVSVPEAPFHFLDWKKSGRQLLTDAPVPTLMGVSINSVEQGAEHLTRAISKNRVVADGILIDEFSQADPSLSLWSQVVPKLAATYGQSGLDVRPYWWGRFSASPPEPLLHQMFTNGHHVVFENYLGEPEDLSDPWGMIQQSLGAMGGDIGAAFGPVLPSVIVALGCQSAPPENLDRNVQVDYKVWLDWQIYALATLPQWKGLGGIMHYVSRYADEENLRWVGRLYQHYAIEGSTSPLSVELGYSYVLHHMYNGDFDDGFHHWTMETAGTGTITLGVHRQLGKWEGRFPHPSGGNNCAILQFKGGESLRLSQDLHNLQRGKLYSLRAMSADMDDLSQGASRPPQIGVELVLRDALVLPEKSFSEPVLSFANDQPFSGTNAPIFTFYRIVFRARSTKDQLSIVSKPAKDLAAHKLLLNSVQVQPYFPDRTESSAPWH